MGKGLGFIAFVIALLMTLFVAHRIGGVQWQLALVLLIGGALIAGFATSVSQAVVARERGTAGTRIGMVVRILLGAFAIACMVAGGVWLVSGLA